MKKSYLLAIFLILAAAQLYVPLAQAWQWENVLKTGQPFYLETVPVDPYDVFRGRYVSLRFKEDEGPIDQQLIASLKPHQTVYAVLAKKDDGTAFLKEIRTVKPVAEPYIKARVSSTDSPLARVSFPFNRYYLPEEFAPQAEQELSRRDSKKKNAVALVYVKDGYGIIENIYVDDKPLLKYLQEQKDS
jgi:uncharacterized membrane-anchored protein